MPPRVVLACLLRGAQPAGTDSQASPARPCITPTSWPGISLQGALDYSDFGSVDMVIEAAIEDVRLKQEIFADLERACRK